MADRLPSDLAKVDPKDAWEPWAPTASLPWDRKWIGHLFRRAAFGATPDMVDKALAVGLPATLDRLMRGQADDELTEAMTTAGRLLVERGSLRGESIIEDLRVWYLYAMIESGHPLREKLTLFWHNHFATSFGKIRSSKLMFEQNVTIRKHALGRFRPFLLDMSKDTAMLIWLDSNRNEKGAANENFAREVMELFSLGVGNYSEKDIREAARAFTGWHHDVGPTAFEYHQAAHDDGPKTVLGQTGEWTGSDVIRICCDQPACARFLVGKLYSYLVSETPPPKHLLVPLEDRFRKTEYDIADLVRTMLGSRLFFSSHAYHKRVKWPVEFVLEAVQSVVPGRVPMGDLTAPLAKMGQVLFSPPNVKGWRTGTDWLNSATLLARNNFAETVALGTWSKPGERRNRNADQATAIAPPAALIPYHETATGAVAGGAVCGAVSATYSFADAQDMKFIVLENKGPVAPGSSAPVQPNSPAQPEASLDPATPILSSKPKDALALVKRIGVTLYGENIPADREKKIEAFLREPAATSKIAEPDKESPSEKIPPRKAPSPSNGAVRAEEKKKAALDMESKDFKARVREALHAMMCLPEYQLN